MIRTTIMALAALMVSPVQSAPLRFDDVAPIVYADIKMAFAEPILDIYIVRRSIKPEALRDERKQLAQLRKWGSIVGHQEERIQVLVRQKSR